MKKLSLLFLFAPLPFLALAQSQLHMEQVANWDVDTLPQTTTNRYNEVWGYSDCSGEEYAILGSAAYVHFFSLEDPSQPQEITAFEGGSITTWRDMKTYEDRAYSVCDFCTEGLLIFDLAKLPDPVILVQQTTSFFGQCHNIFIDTQHGRLYAAGTDSLSNGLVVLDLEDPDNPTLLANAVLPGGYVHDVYVRDNIAYCSHGSAGLYIYDMSDPTAPVLLGTLTSYPQQGYNHSSWLSEDGQFLVFADESFNRGLKIADVSDPSDIQVKDVFRSALLAPDTASIAHNPFILGNHVYISYYHDGVQIFDISDPTQVEQTAWYDTEPGNTNYNGFTGCWGVYPFLPSGLILASDMHNGLFILQTDSIEMGASTTALFPDSTLTLTGLTDLCPGDSLVIQADPAAGTYIWYQNSLELGETSPGITVTEEGLYEAQVANGHCRIWSEAVAVTVGFNPDVTLTAEDTLACVGDTILLSLIEPADAYQWFVWDALLVDETGISVEVTETAAYSVQVTLGNCSVTSEEIFVEFSEGPTAGISEDNGIFTASGGVAYQWYLDGAAIPGATSATLAAQEPGLYSVEVFDEQGCSNFSEELMFVIIAAGEVPSEQTAFYVSPNPFSDQLVIHSLQGILGACSFRLIASSGQVVRQWEAALPAVEDLSYLPAGLYFLQVQNEAIRWQGKVLKQ